MTLVGLAARKLAQKQRTAKLAAAFPNGVRCQKCLNFGHWSYECKEKRKYVHRSSRTKQLSKHLAEKSANATESMPANESRALDAGNEVRIDREKRTKRKIKRSNSSSSSSSSDSSNSSSGSTNSDSSSSSESDSSSSDFDGSSSDGESGSSSGSESDGSSSSSKSSDSAYEQENSAAPKKKKRRDSSGESSDGEAQDV